VKITTSSAEWAAGDAARAGGGLVAADRLPDPRRPCDVLLERVEAVAGTLHIAGQEPGGEAVGRRGDGYRPVVYAVGSHRRWPGVSCQAMIGRIRPLRTAAGAGNVTVAGVATGPRDVTVTASVRGRSGTVPLDVFTGAVFTRTIKPGGRPQER
jgi:hypothetical protein